MILIFDLDDTLYDERTFVLSGFAAVARWGEERFGAPAADSLAELTALLDRDGRGKVFDDWLKGRAPVRDALRVYRHHQPEIALSPAAAATLDALADRPLYLVTDGHKLVQANKVAALGIAGRFRRCYLTNRYGRHNAKPSLYCFDLIRRRERADWSDLVYVGDNPAKDFVALNAVGATTVRVLTGRHRDDPAAAGHEARFRLGDLSELPPLLESL
jgi:putative hydrolase of the HAD superfamily